MRERLLTNLLFNLVVALWVWHDARRRRARKPLFAAVLALVWGPLGVAFWAAERPLRADERRVGGTASVMARHFAVAWTAMVPAIYVLVVPVVADRSAVPDSLGDALGVTQASLIVTLAAWLLPAALALALGSLLRDRRVESGSAATGHRSVHPAVAVSVAGVVAFLYAFARAR